MHQWWKLRLSSQSRKFSIRSRAFPLYVAFRHAELAISVTVAKPHLLFASLSKPSSSAKHALSFWTCAGDVAQHQKPPLSEHKDYSQDYYSYRAG